MNDEYLWQKTGDDPEIRKLENALAEFRYRDCDPPVLPVALTQPAIRRWRFPFAFAATGFAAVVIAAGAWFQASNIRHDNEIVFIYHPADAAPGQVEPVPATQPPPAPLKEQFQKTRGLVRASVTKTPKRANPKNGRTAVLTKEERYAYERLLLALSISSSKINIVRNTINGVDEKPVTPNSHNR